MAKAATGFRKSRPDAAVVLRFLGATRESADGRSLLVSLCRQISRIYGEDESLIPEGYDQLCRELAEKLTLATADRPLIVLLDALDQLSARDNAVSLDWLPPVPRRRKHLKNEPKGILPRRRLLTNSENSWQLVLRNS